MVTVLVILLAFAGLAANLAVQLPSRRRDAASLRVVGVRTRSIMVGVVAEFLLVLGAAALAGIAAGALAQYVVVRTVTLGFADTELTPRVLPSFHLTHRLRARGRGDARPPGARLGVRGPHRARRPHLVAARERR